MGDGSFKPNSTIAALTDTLDLDFMDELLFEGCWLETADGFNFPQPGISTSGAPCNTPLLPLFETDTGQMSVNQTLQFYQTERNSSQNPLPLYPKIEDLSGHESGSHKSLETANSSSLSESFLFEAAEPGKRWWIGPSENPGPSSSSVKERLMWAIGFMKESTNNSNTLIQLWVPIKSGGRFVLTTNDQPYTLDPSCKSLANYRDVSRAYNFPAEEDSKESVGLPGRVFLGKLPEWTPDVRFFRSHEYPRVDYAQQCDVHGSLALPVFEQGSRTCLGVIEIVMTAQKNNYQPELANICKALEAVDLRSSQNLSPPNVQACSELLYQSLLPEIVELVTSICNTHSLPVALTWAPCIQQGKGGCRHSDENYDRCVSTVDSACFVSNQEILNFHEACSEHHLLRGQGIVGMAFSTNKPCFATDTTAFSKTEYPLSHHARMFGLRAALAVHLRGIHDESVEFVIEFFLPKYCQDAEEQKHIVDSLFFVAQRGSRSLYVVDRELVEITVDSDGRIKKYGTQNSLTSPTQESTPGGSSWIADLMKSQQKGKGVTVSLDYQKEPSGEHMVTTNWDGQHHSEFGQPHQIPGLESSFDAGLNSSSFRGSCSFDGRKTGEKRRTKTEKTISLQVLRQYFAGSLKDAAKSIGVCPTTLKRICRQHGITRWPSRKIKKVGHSLKKLQLVIDSVQGTEGSIQIRSFYSSFPELSSPNLSGSVPPFSSLKMSDSRKQLISQPGSGPFSTTSKSPSSSGSQSSGSSLCCSTGAKQHNTTIDASSNGDTSTENLGGVIKRICSDAQLHAPSQEETRILARSQSHRSFGDYPRLETLPTLQKPSGQNVRDGATFRVKATFGEEKIRFSVQPNWHFKDLQEEIAKRFNINDISKMDLKYLDDDHEWVLLTCDDDLDECIDIFRSSQLHTVKLSLHQASHPILGSSFGSSSPS